MSIFLPLSALSVFCLTGVSMDRLPIAIFNVLKPIGPGYRYSPFLPEPFNDQKFPPLATCYLAVTIFCRRQDFIKNLLTSHFVY
jgi:hypothetical protein